MQETKRDIKAPPAPVPGLQTEWGSIQGKKKTQVNFKQIMAVSVMTDWQGTYAFCFMQIYSN